MPSFFCLHIPDVPESPHINGAGTCRALDITTAQNPPSREKRRKISILPAPSLSVPPGHGLTSLLSDLIKRRGLNLGCDTDELTAKSVLGRGVHHLLTNGSVVGGPTHERTRNALLAYGLKQKQGKNSLCSTSLRARARLTT